MLSLTWGVMLCSLLLPAGSVLVHCAAGVSRSATVVLGYLMARQNLSLAAALQHLKEVRPWVSPNPGFMQQLEAYETSKCDLTNWKPWNLVCYEQEQQQQRQRQQQQQQELHMTAMELLAVPQPPPQPQQCLLRLPQPGGSGSQQQQQQQQGCGTQRLGQQQQQQQQHQGCCCAPAAAAAAAGGAGVGSNVSVASAANSSLFASLATGVAVGSSPLSSIGISSACNGFQSVPGSNKKAAAAVAAAHAGLSS
jgi:hypothetical protein